MEDMGSIIKRLRKEKRINQDELANYLGVSKAHISYIESGKRVPSDEIKEALTDFFNVDMDYLYGKSEIKNKTTHGFEISLDEKFIIERYRELAEEDKSFIARILKILTNYNNK